MYKVITDGFPIDNSICKECIHRMSRVIIPLDYQMYGIDLDEFDLGEEEDLIVEQHVCLVLQQDLDGVVTECNRFSDINNGAFFTTNPYGNE